MVGDKSPSVRARNTIIYIIITLLGLICLLPLWNVLMISFSSSAAVSANRVKLWPVDFTTVAYKKILEDSQFWRSFWIAVRRVFWNLIINMVLIVPMAYALTKNKDEFKGRSFYMGVLIVALLFNGGMIPTYMLVKDLGLLDTIWALILPGAIPVFSVILLMNFFRGVPKALEEAALIDGADPWTILLKIYLPVSTPVLATVALFSIVGSWNDFFSGLIYIRKPENYPIMTYIQSLTIDIQDMLKQGVNHSSLENLTELSNRNLNSAKIVVAVIPLLLIYPFLQKYLISGLTIGSVKG